MNEPVDWCKVATEYLPENSSCRVFRILEDTTDFYDVNYGDVLLLDDVGYLVRGTETEKKFGLEGEPKPWVKSGIDLRTGEKKIIKLTFLEEFECRIYGLKFSCLRNPEKEARILDKVRGNPDFMQGIHCVDGAGNNVRIIDRISGISLDNVIRSMSIQHYDYYNTVLEEILLGLAYAFKAIGDLHRMGEIHGDITPDHIFVERDTGRYRWIDFDYDYKERDNLISRDIFEMGTVLAFVVGKDYLSYSQLHKTAPEKASTLKPSDMLAIFPNQIANLKLVYPHIHESISEILLRFSLGAQHPYQDAETLAADIARVSDLLS
ncbi:MAG: hypothetical protein WC647_04200 [Desulfomonilaceae bacterium]|jgi:serine/threonine protein kinase